MCVPVDGNDDHVHSKGGVVMIVLMPDTPTRQDIIVRLVKAVVHAGHDDQQPGEGGEKLVGPNGSRIIAFPLDKRID